MKFILILLIVHLSLFAQQYTASGEVMAVDKKTACEQALIGAKENAISQAGTLIISSFSNSTTVNNENLTSMKNSELNSISVGIVKLLSKNENIEVTKDYQFYCKVDATFEVDENEMKKAMTNYLDNKNRQEAKIKIAIRATGHSAEGQSKYEAMKTAELDAKRNLLDEIRGSELMSNLEANNGKLSTDTVMNELRSNIKFVKVLSSNYDTTTKSAEVIIGLTEDGLNENIKKWKKD